jgi:hypothetical protein
MKLPLLVIPVLLWAACMESQTSTGRATAHTRAAGAETLTTTSLKVDGLTYAREIDRLYWGDFEHLHLDRSGFEFGLMISSYMHDFGVVCAADLPRNKVQIMAQRCTDYSYWVNGYGVEQPGSRSCTHYETYGTGVFADPELYQASQFEDGKMATVLLGQIGSTMTKTGDAGINAAMGNLMQSVDFARQAGDFKTDLQSLFHKNACGGAPLKRLERNLIAFATNRPPIRMADIPTSSGPTRDSDYQTLLDDLVGDQSSGWMLNRFVRSSISNVAVVSRDSAGHPLQVSADYAYDGARGRAEGTVTLRFEGDAPQCLVFSDLPDACRAVNHSFAAAYEDGKYVTDHPAAARKYVAPDLRQVDIVADPNQQVLVEIPGKALDARQGFVIPMTGKLLQDISGTGPGGGRVILVHAGSAVSFSVFNSQRGTEFHLSTAGDTPAQTIYFNSASKEFRAGVDSLPHDGSPLKLSFDLPANIRRKMLLTDYEKQKTTVVAQASPAPVVGGPAQRIENGDSGGSPGRPGGVKEPHRILPSGTVMQLRFASAISVDEVNAGKLFPATVVNARTSPDMSGRETLAEGTTVFVRITEGNGGTYYIQGDHAVVQGINVPLETNQLPRMPIRSTARSAPIQVRGLGNIRLPAGAQAGRSTVLLPADIVLRLSTRSNAILDGAPQ